MPDDKIEFRIGFTSDNANANALQMLGDAVVSTQERIDTSIAGLAESTERSAQRITETTTRSISRSNRSIARTKAESTSISEELSKSFEQFEGRLRRVGRELENGGSALEGWADAGGANLDRLRERYESLSKTISGPLNFNDGDSDDFHKVVADLASMEQEIKKINQGRRLVSEQLREAEIAEQQAFMAAEREKINAMAETNKAIRKNRQEVQLSQDEIQDAFDRADAELSRKRKASGTRTSVPIGQSRQRGGTSLSAETEQIKQDTDDIRSRFDSIFSQINREKEAIKGVSDQLKSLGKEASLDELQFGFEQATLEAQKWATESDRAAGRVLKSFSQMGQGVATLGRAYALFEFSGTRVIGTQNSLAEQNQITGRSTIQFLAQMQGVIDTFSGAERTISSFVSGIDGVAAFLKARGLAARASERAMRLQQLAGERRAQALRRERAALDNATQAEVRNLRARQRSNSIRSRRRGGAGAGIIAGGLLGGPEGLALDAAQGLAGSRRLRLAGLRTQRRLLGGLGRVVNPVTTSIGAGTLTTTGTAAVTSIGALAAAAAAAAAGVGLAGKAIFDTGERLVKGERNFEVNSFADRIGQATATAGDFLVDGIRPFVDLGDVINDEATARLEAARKRLKETEAIDRAVNAVRINAERERLQILVRSEQRLLEVRLNRAITPGQRRAVLAEAITDRLSRADRFSQDRIAAESAGNSERVSFAYQQEFDTLNRITDLRRQERAEVAAAARDRRQSLRDEIEGTEAVLRNRLAEIDALRDSLKSAGQRFVELDKGDREDLIRNFRRARRGERLDIDELQDLSRIDTESVRRLVGRQFGQRIKESGFVEVFGQEEQEQIAKARQDAQRRRDELAEQARRAGAGPVGTLEQIRARIELNPQVEIVDQRTYDLNTDKVVRDVTEVINQSIERLDARIVAIVEEELEQRGKIEESAARNPKPRSARDVARST